MIKREVKKSQVPVALVTGATGFVGSHLARRLFHEGWQVHILIRANSKVPPAAEFSHMTIHVYDGSTSSMISCIKLASPDVVFHLASLFLSQHEASEVDALIQSNVLFGAQLLEGMNAGGVRFIINTGTSWQHFNNENYNPVCLYAATKQAFQALVEYYVQAHGFSVITLKLFDTYGSDDPRQKLFYLLNKASYSGELLNMSEGNQMIDIVHIDDVVDAYLIAAQRLLGGRVLHHEIYSISSGQPLSLRELVQRYCEVTKNAINVNWGGRPYRNREVMSTWSNGESLGGWKPKIDLNAGLAKMGKI